MSARDPDTPLDAQAGLQVDLSDLRTLLLDAHGGIVLELGPDGRVRRANTWASSRLGVDRDGLHGRAFAGDLVEADAVQQRAHDLSTETGATIAADAAVLSARLRDGVTTDEQAWALRHADGSHVPVHLTAAALRDGAGRPAGLLLVERLSPAEAALPFLHHDTLTGLPERAVLADRAEMALQRGARNRSVVAVLLVDLVGFDALCEERGHGVGGDVLRATASRLHFALRKTDTAVRLDRGQFAAMLVDLHRPEEAQAIAAKLRDALSARVNVGVALLDLQVRIGVAWSPDHGDQLLPLLQQAEAALAALPADASGVACAEAAAA